MTYRCLVAVALVLLCALSAEAALTTPKCLVAKRKAWATLRKCEAAEDAKRIAAKAADFAKCRSKHQAALAKIDAKAAKAAVPCRYGDNGDGTLTDYDTGLMWERKIDDALLCVAGVVRCVTKQFTWTEALGIFVATLNGETGFAGHTDWRMPTLAELQTTNVCATPGVLCIDPAFAPTIEGDYWSTTLSEFVPNGSAFGVAYDADVPQTFEAAFTFSLHARAVRTAL